MQQLELFPAPVPASWTPPLDNTPHVVEQAGRYFVRLGDDRALIGPFKNEQAAQAYES